MNKLSLVRNSVEDLVFISGNQAKIDYLRKWLGYEVPHQKLNLEEIQSLDPHVVIEHKAREAYALIGKTVLVEDVRFSFSAFGGKLPGTLVKWFLEESGTDGLIKMLKGFDDRRATAGITYGIFDGESLYTFDAEVTGTVPEQPRTSEYSGWHSSKSWNSIFIPNGSDKTYAEMTDEELQPFSHRYKAIVQLQEFLAQHNEA